MFALAHPDAVGANAGRALIEGELQHLVPPLLDLVRYPADASVRETALQCLLALMDLPYARLHPYKQQVGPM